MGSEMCIRDRCRRGDCIGIVPSIADPSFLGGGGGRELVFIDLPELAQHEVHLSCSVLVRRRENSVAIRTVYDALTVGPGVRNDGE